MKFTTDRRRARTFMCTRHVGAFLDAMGDGWNGPLNKVDAFRYEIPRSYKPGMRTNGLVFIDESMVPQLRQDQAPEQVANVATMPGILGAAMAMPDIHWGYGFPIGGVAAFDYDEGVISPGGIGYDINCGVRLIRTNLLAADVRSNLRALTDACFENVPSGVGEGGITKVSRQDLAKLATEGVGWSVEKGYAWSDDPDRIEARGCLEDADFSKVGERAIARGKDQVGSLGAGNHFVEIQKVDRVDDERAAKALGIGEPRSEEHTSELQSPCNLVCRLLLEKKKGDTRSAPGEAANRNIRAERARAHATTDRLSHFQGGTAHAAPAIP